MWKFYWDMFHSLDWYKHNAMISFVFSFLDELSGLVILHKRCCSLILHITSRCSFINMMNYELDIESKHEVDIFLTHRFKLGKQIRLYRSIVQFNIAPFVNKKCDKQNFMNQCFIMCYFSAWFMVVQICNFSHMYCWSVHVLLYQQKKIILLFLF